MLSETWLKKSVKDREIIESTNYNIFRNDRSQLTHPSDPENPTKYRKSGGGVLIAIRSDLDVSYKRISMRRGAEILAVELTINNCKFIFCVVYRVGTLGEDNHDSIMNSLNSFYKSKKPKRVFILGDFNLSTVTWPVDETHVISKHIEKIFVDSFNELGLTQCINAPTHNKGRTLDLLLTNGAQLIDKLNVAPDSSICKSDHYLVSFEIKANFRFKTQCKRSLLNFKRANWDALNHDIRQTNWNAMLESQEPEVAWSSFKSTLFQLIGRHIPTITIKGDFKSPWFDSEVYEAYRAKKRAHKAYKGDESNNELLGFKFEVARKNFKNISDEKMRDNLYNNDDPALITKKFWSHVKFSSKSHRLPETLYLNGRYRNNSLDKADLFNSYFYEQFSEKSFYDVDVDWTNDDAFNIDFNHRRIRKLLGNINSNKACGPDGIHGKVLKNCASSLAYPLPITFI